MQKKRLLTRPWGFALAAIVGLHLLSATAFAHFIEGSVFCTDSTTCAGAVPTTPMPGVTVTATGSQTGALTAVTDANGAYHIDVPEVTQTFIITINASPVVCPAGGAITCFLDINVNQGQVTGQNFLVHCGNPPPLGEIGDTVFCDKNGNGIQDNNEPGIPGVKVKIICTDSSGNVLTGETVTDANGHYLFTQVPPGHCDVTVDTTTAPPDCSVPKCDTTVSHDMAPGEIFLDADFCFTPPGPCPVCVDPALGLGKAAGCTVLQLGAAKISITGPAGGILGDICVAPGGSLSMSGDEYVTGTIRLGAGATFSNSSHGTVTVQKNVDLSAEIAAANAAAVNAANLPPTQIFTKLDGSVSTIIGNAGVNVIKVTDVSLSGKQITLFAPAGGKFVINVTGKFVLTGGGAGPQIRVAGGIQPKDVLYNIIGTGADVAFSGGGGGVNCCAAIVDGTLLAPGRKINLSPGLVNGEVISGKDISIVSGSSVRCPPCPHND